MDSHKKVDESWKEAVQKEKSGASPGPARGETPTAAPAEEDAGESEFLGFVSTLAMQALMALGDVPHPQTGQAHEDPAQAKYLIDVLRLLSEKTKGNLTPHEAAEMKNLLYQLKMKFVQKGQGVPQP